MSLAVVAHSYATRGWPVLPLHTWLGNQCSCGRADCASPAKHPRLAHGLKDASTDAELVSSWWQQWPTANVGLVTGVVFDVLDIDGEEGISNFKALCAELGVTLPPGPRSRTGGGGRHILFAATGEGNRAGLIPKVDWRGSGGYIVAPPSLHRSGRAYEWVNDHTNIPACPDWLRDLVGTRNRDAAPAGEYRPLPAGNTDGTPWGLAAFEGEIRDLRRAPNGQRNDSLNAAAYNLYQLVAGGELSEQHVEYHLRSAAQSIGLDEHEINGTLRSAREAGMQRPRNAPNLQLLRGGKPVDTPNSNAQPSVDPEPAKPVLEFVTARQLVEEVDAAPPVGFMCRPIWPADAYGVIAAEKKAGKTWLDIDMVVSVASGTPWLGIYPVERAGHVLVFLGEGGKRKMLRRFRAVCEDRGLTFEDLPITLCFRVPHLTSVVHLAEIADRIEQDNPVLVVIDPLYLAARGAKTAILNEMGEILETAQLLCQRHGAALAVIHHWNQTGKGKGADRMSGAGPAEWGRVLASASVENRHTDDETKMSTVTLDIEFTGDEIPDTEQRIRRRVWTDNPDDLDAPMHYCIDPLEPRKKKAEADDMAPATRRVLGIIDSHVGTITVNEIGDILANDTTGIPLKARTIQDALNDLKDLGRAVLDHVEGRTAHWRAHTPDLEDENAD